MNLGAEKSAFFFTRACVWLAVVGLASVLHAQQAITGVTYGSSADAADSTAGNIVYLNKSQTVNQVSTATTNYIFDGPIASNVYFRRGSTGTNGATAWYQGTDFSSSGGYQVYGQGDTTPTLPELMLTSNLSEGLRNPFANTVSSSSIGPTSNIERIDFYFGASGHVKIGSGCYTGEHESLVEGYTVGGTTQVKATATYPAQVAKPSAPPFATTPTH